jgi:very-short-patch-repair endonuclease
MADLTHLQHLVALHGVFLRREAIAAGMTDKTLRRELAAGTLVRVRYGAYTLAEKWATLDARGRHLLLIRAVLRTHPDRVVVSHESAAVVHGLDLWNVRLDKVHLTRVDHGSGRQTTDTAHHEGLCLEGDAMVVDGIPDVKPARAALEAASGLGIERGLVILDSGLRKKLFTEEEMEAQAALMRSWPGVIGLHLTVQLADGRRGSLAESRMDYLFWVSGLPAPRLQYEIYDDHGINLGAVDFAWPEHKLIVEFDGKVKYEEYLRPGETPGDAVFREKKREDAIRDATGWRVIRVTWDMLADPRLLIAELRAALSVAA